MEYAVTNRLAASRARLERIAGSTVFHEPRRVVDLRRQYLDELETRLAGGAKLQLVNNSHRLERAMAALNTLNPQRQLERGYAMVFDDSGKKLVVSSDLPADTPLNIRFADGQVKVKTL